MPCRRNFSDPMQFVELILCLQARVGRKQIDLEWDRFDVFNDLTWKKFWFLAIKNSILLQKQNIQCNLQQGSMIDYLQAQSVETTLTKFVLNMFVLYMSKSTASFIILFVAH